MEKPRKRRPLRKEKGAIEPLKRITSKFTPKEYPAKPVATGDTRKVKSGALKRKLRKDMK